MVSINVRKCWVPRTPGFYRVENFMREAMSGGEPIFTGHLPETFGQIGERDIS